MSSDEDSEDQGHASFIIMSAAETFDGEERMMSRAAYELQVRATAHSASCGYPGFVPDEYLSGLGTETTITVAELCTAGMWERVDGGYRVLDWEAVEVCLNRLREIRGEDQQALAWEREREGRVLAQMATAVVVNPAVRGMRNPGSPHRARGAGAIARRVGAVAPHRARQHPAATRARTMTSPVQENRRRQRLR